MQVHGELRGKTHHRELVKSPIVSIASNLQVTLHSNDVPVTLFYKSGNRPWASLLINKHYTDEAVPHYSDIYLVCSAAREETVKYSINY